MGIKILQVNVRNWKSNRYNFQVMNATHNPDIILLNETAMPENGKIKMLGYYSLSKSNGPHTRVAILKKQNLSEYLKIYRNFLVYIVNII